MNLKELSTPLDISQIDFRVQSINKGGYATILAYKDARVDRQRLDDVVGPLNWKREHSRDNQNCTVSIWDEYKGQWVGKEDTGTESRTESQKGLASDSFKRACFMWGIGVELYDYPRISVKLRDDEWDKETGKATYKLQVREWIWFSQWEDGELLYLAAKDGGAKGNNQAMRYQYGTFSKDAKSAYLCNNIPSVMVIKESIESGDYSAGAEAWNELTEEERGHMWSAPSKFGVFTTAEKKIMQTNEFLQGGSAA